MLLRDQEQIEFPVLIDELGGEVHRRYGALPNASFLIDKSGRVAYRSLASHSGSLGAALEELLERQKERGVHHAVVHGGEDAISPSLKTFLNAYRAIERGGYDAMVNFRGELGIPGRVVLRGGRMARPSPSIRPSPSPPPSASSQPSASASGPDTSCANAVLPTAPTTPIANLKNAATTTSTQR